MSEALQRIESAPPDVVRQTPNVADMLQAVIQGGVTESNVGAVAQMVQLYERMQALDAEKQFAQAFVALQAEMPKVQATRPVPDKQGNVKYRFAPFEDIMNQVGPILQRHGFTVSFSSDTKEGRILQTCTLQHVGGHKRSNTFAVRVGQGPPGSTETQADGAANTYAKRFALCDALNIVIAHLDQDARAEGGHVTAEQAEELERRVHETNSDVMAFLKFAGAKKFSEIPAAKYNILDGFLTKKERQGR